VQFKLQLSKGKVNFEVDQETQVQPLLQTIIVELFIFYQQILIL